MNLQALAALIGREYGIAPSGIEKLDAGFDRNSAVYRFFAGGKKFFLKIRTGDFNRPGLWVPFYLSAGLRFPHLLEPVKTRKGALYAKDSRRRLILFPYVEGRSGWERSPGPEQFVELGKFFRRLHGTASLPRRAGPIPRENFSAKYRKRVKKLLSRLDREDPQDPPAADFCETLGRNKDKLLEMILFLEKISGEVKRTGRHFCLCHGDIHAGNLLITPNNFFVVDWDTLILAPRERDLMFIGGGIGGKWDGAGEAAFFYRGYGSEAPPDRTLIAYYRIDRVLQDIQEFHRQICGAPSNAADKERSLAAFKQQFDPGGVVDIALGTGAGKWTGGVSLGQR
jgi:spectinomycin phosphotransferase